MLNREDDKTFLDCLNKVKDPLNTLCNLLQNDQITYVRVKWDVESKRAELHKIISDIDLMKKNLEIIKVDNEKVKQQGLEEKKGIVQDGIKFLSEASILLVKVKGLCSEVEKRKYLEFSEKSNELLSSVSEAIEKTQEEPAFETVEPKKRGRPAKVAA